MSSWELARGPRASLSASILPRGATVSDDPVIRLQDREDEQLIDYLFELYGRHTR